MRAELWPETCFCPYAASVERADRDRRVDRVAPNESSVAQLRAELWPETWFCPVIHIYEYTARDFSLSTPPLEITAVISLGFETVTSGYVCGRLHKRVDPHLQLLNDLAPTSSC